MRYQSPEQQRREELNRYLRDGSLTVREAAQRAGISPHDARELLDDLVNDGHAWRDTEEGGLFRYRQR